MKEIEDLIDEDPEASAHYAVAELHYGRLDWLAVHIRRCGFRISPIVAQKILALIEKSDPNCFYELKAVRKSGLLPALQDPQLKQIRDFDMAVEVARSGGFKRGHLERACHAVGLRYGLKPEHVRRIIKPLRQLACDVVEEEEMLAAYVRGEIDFLGCPKKE